MTINAEEQLIIFPTCLNNTGLYTCEKEDGQSALDYHTDLHVYGDSDVSMH